MKTYEVVIDNPISYNQAYRTFKGRVLLSEEGREYAGEWVMVPKKKPFENPFVNQKTIKGGKHKGRIKVFVEGRCGKMFRDAGVPEFSADSKVIVKAWATWPDERARDMSNFQKLTEDAFQNGKFIPNDSKLLWRNMNFKVVPGVFQIKLYIEELIEED